MNSWPSFNKRLGHSQTFLSRCSWEHYTECIIYDLTFIASELNTGHGDYELDSAINELYVFEQIYLQFWRTLRKNTGQWLSLQKRIFKGEAVISRRVEEGLVSDSVVHGCIWIKKRERNSPVPCLARLQVFRLKNDLPHGACVFCNMGYGIGISNLEKCLHKATEHWSLRW